MVDVYSQLVGRFKQAPRCWLVTGVAGFIGSHLLEALLDLGQKVVGLDNFSTGRQSNLDDVRSHVGEEAWRRFRLIEGDVCDLKCCERALVGVDLVLHQAALGSVPRSIAAPLASHASNVDGFLNLLWSAKEAGVRRIVYASSSSVYGDSQVLPKTEGELGQPLSPYAVTKLVDELYAGVFGKLYQMELVGLRYFNVFGPRQNPAGPYAAVIPRWIDALMQGRSCVIFGDGETSRDFCYVANVVQANLLAADTTEVPALNRVYNVSCGEQTTLNRLFEIIRDGLASLAACKADVEVEHADFRAGDVRHSLADISAIRKYLGYEPQYMLPGGISKTLDWYFSTSKS